MPTKVGHQNKLLLFLMAVPIVLTFYISASVYNLSTTFQELQPVTIQDIRHAISEEIKSMQTLETSWEDANGNTHTVKTTRIQNETAKAFAERHQEAVDAAQLLYPPV